MLNRFVFLATLLVGASSLANPLHGYTAIGEETKVEKLALDPGTLDVKRVEPWVARGDAHHAVDPMPGQLEIRLTVPRLSTGKLHHGDTMLTTRPLDYKIPDVLSQAKSVDVEVSWKLGQTNYDDTDHNHRHVCVPRAEEVITVKIPGTDLVFTDTAMLLLVPVDGPCS